MSQTTGRRWASAGLLAALLGTSFFSGCTQRNLFADQDPAQQKIKYWDANDSVHESREARQRARDAGFGFSNGPAVQ